MKIYNHSIRLKIATVMGNKTVHTFFLSDDISRWQSVQLYDRFFYFRGDHSREGLHAHISVFGN